MAIAAQRACGALLAVHVAPPSAETWMPPGLATAAMRFPSADVADANQGCAVGVASRGVQTVPGATLPGRVAVTTYWPAFCASCQRPLPWPVTRTWSPGCREVDGGSVT